MEIFLAISTGTVVVVGTAVLSLAGVETSNGSTGRELFTRGARNLKRTCYDTSLQLVGEFSGRADL